MLIHTISYYELSADKKVIMWMKLGRASFGHGLIRDCYKASVLRDKGTQRRTVSGRFVQGHHTASARTLDTRLFYS